jgi:Concanavalin A-like lectin/glucanases superfamily/Putative esterase
MSKRILVVLCVSLIALPGYAGAAGLTATYLQTASNGVIWYDATSEHNGPGTTILRILQPTNPAPGMPRRFIYVLPVITDVDLGNEFGDGLEELLALNVHNAYNASIIAPSFQAVPWYADHTSLSERSYETFMVQDLVPWVQANLSVTGQEEHWLIGFSKSGFGAVTLLFRNPTVFNAAAAWDFPADQPDPFDWNMLDNYGTNANFQNNYRLTSGWIAARGAPFQAAPRLWLSDDYATYNGTLTFRDEVLAFAGRLVANGVQFLMEASGATRPHTWTSGWLSEAVAGLQSMQFGVPPPDTSPRDDFNRPDGGLGSKWLADPLWGTGTEISGNQVTATAGGGGAYYWNAAALEPDQYSQIRITGDIGVWTGVSVRGGASPSQGYWVAVKDDGAYLYSFVNGVFYELVHDATPWSTGDVLRLEARTVATNTARLTVHRNDVVLFTHDDAAYFIAGGQPGIGLYASGAMALDDWEGGTLNPGPTPDTTPPVRSNGSPSGTLAAGTTQTTLSLTTNESATCRYATSPGLAYGAMANTFATTGGTAHSTTVTGLTDGSSYNVFVRCQDPATNANTNDFSIAFSVAQPADTTPPVRSSGSPSGTLAAGTTQTTLGLTTNENATCRYATSPGVAYGSMSNTFATTGGTAHSTTVNGLANGGSYSFFVRCQDAATNANTNDFSITFSVAQPADTTPPVRSNGSPSGTLAAGTTQTALGLTTNESASCRYATSPGLAYGAMTNTFAATGGTAHSTTVNGLTNGSSYSFYVRCQDAATNANTNDFTITFSVAVMADVTPPALSNGSPSGTLAAGTTQTTLSLATNESATCRYATSPGVAYGSMPNAFAATGGTAHSTTVNGLTNGGSYTFYVRCRDAATNANTNDFTIAFSVAQPADTTPPVPSNGSPSGTLTAGTTQTSLSLTTNESATCRYATSPGVAYGSMPNAFGATGGTAHSTTVNGLTNGSSYTFYVRCQDAATNASTNDFAIAFSVAQSADFGLVAAFGFNEGAGTSAADASGRGHTGVVSGAVWSTAGRFGNALSFDGVNDKVTVLDSALLDLTTGMTLSVWIFPTAHGNGTWRNVLIKERSGGEVYNLYSNTDTNVPTVYAVRSAAPSTPLDARGTAQLPLNAWTHLAATYDGTTLRLYVNGSQVGSRAVSGALLTSTGALRIGGNNVWGEYFKGRIDEVRIYNRALSQGEIQSDMTRPITP